jgi:outer membrane protein
LKLYAITVLLFAALLAASPPVPADDYKIGYVSPERILNDSKIAKLARQRLDQEFARDQQEIAQLQAHLRTMQDDLEKNLLTMSQSNRQLQEREIRSKDIEIQRKMVAYDEELKVIRQRAIDEVIEQVDQVVKRIAVSENFDIIFRQAVWASPGIDITGKVIRTLDDMTDSASPSK